MRPHVEVSRYARVCGVNREHRHDYSLRFEWGLSEATAVASDADVAVIVDVLSFTTTLSVAIDAGIEVLPYRWRDASAVQYAAAQDAVLAVGRSVATPGSISLSPGTIRSAQGVDRLVLPSPDGSSIAYELNSSVGVCIGASLRPCGREMDLRKLHEGNGRGGDCSR